MAEKRRTLVLINPANTLYKGYLLRRQSKQVPLALGIIAALTPPDWRIKVLDENFRTFKFYDADLVGITAFTSNVNRAYQIAEEYRQKNIPVVMGGIHVSCMPDEALQYADSVVIGEAEGSWEKVIKDFENNSLQRVYQSQPGELYNLPAPRHDLFHPGYLFASIQTSRGCPMNCDFCSVPRFNGNKYRLRPVNEILDELQAIPHKLIYFVDDNIIGYNKESEEHALALFRGMIERKLNKEWFAQASMNISQNPEVLQLASESGCKMLLLGIESEKPAQLTETNKKLNLKLGVNNYWKVFRAIHRHGISILGAFIFGLDNDTPANISQRVHYTMHSGIDVIQPSVLTPLPGTRLYEKMEAENRILRNQAPEDWKYYHFTDVVFQPKQMSPTELETLMDAAYHKMYSKKAVLMRFICTLWNTRNLHTAVWAYNSNMNFYAMAKEKFTKKEQVK